MTTTPPIPIQTVMRRSLAGALATDPVLDERRRRARRRAADRREPDRPPVARTPATLPQSS